MDWTSLREVSEIVRNFGQALALVGGVFALFTWLYARRDRSTEVLLELERRFSRPDIKLGRLMVENDEEYLRIRDDLIETLTPADEFDAGYEGAGAGAKRTPKAIDGLDPLLRFYVLLCGVRGARQVPDSSLRQCFRFWLAHYYSPARRELRLYIDAYYPTLSQWLRRDRRRLRRWLGRSFFTPRSFGWDPRKPSTADIQRAMAGRVLVITGAGISRESGVPTYRGREGYWHRENPRALARRSAFEWDAEKIWRWYGQRRADLRQRQPNPGHFAIAELARTAADFLLVTQNVDHLHEAAGVTPDQLVHIHGELRINRCTTCGLEDAEDVDPSPPPSCTECGGLLRPGVVWFDEELDPRQRARVEDFLARGRCDLVLVIGTTASFSYIVDWSLRTTWNPGCLIEINPEPSVLSAAADLAIRKEAATTLPRLLGLGGSMRAGRGTHPRPPVAVPAGADGEATEAASVQAG